MMCRGKVPRFIIGIGRHRDCRWLGGWLACRMTWQTSQSLHLQMDVMETVSLDLAKYQYICMAKFISWPL